MNTTLTTEYTTGDGRKLTVGDIAQLYRSCVDTSVPSNGSIQKLGENSYSLIVGSSTVSCDILESIKTFKVYSLTTGSNGSHKQSISSVRCVSGAHDVVELASAISNNGRFTAKLKSPCTSSKTLIPSDGPQRQLLEIWDRSRLIKVVDTSDIEVHGTINTDTILGHFCWSRFGDQDKLLYTCQRKRPKHSSFFKQQNNSERNEVMLGSVTPDARDSSDKNYGQEFDRREDWGETLTGIEHTIVAVLDVSNNCRITTIDIEGFSLGDPRWLDNDTKIIAIAYKEYPRKLGLIHCKNRESKLVVFSWQSSVQTAILEVNNEKESYWSPRVNHAGDKFVFLAQDVYGPHMNSVRIFMYDLKTGTKNRISDSSTGSGELFMDSLPKNCFSSDDKYLILNAFDYLHRRIFLLNLTDSKLTEVRLPTTASYLLDFRYDIILACGSEVNATPTLFVTTLSLPDTNDIAWHQIEDCIHLDEIEYEPYKIPTTDSSSFVSAILVKPNLCVLHNNYPNRDKETKSTLVNNQCQLPTVVVLHGGPHSSFRLEYMAGTIFYARLGLQCLMINYRGSIGVSDEYTRSLCGKIGSLDVEDCLHVIRCLVQDRTLDPTKLIVSGGSHGGFLACHLSCQEEFKFTSAIIRNPVVDLMSMLSSSDIPDWVLAETFGRERYEPSWVPNSQELTEMNARSPISRSTKAFVPTLMLLGSNDRRVKMSQGERWIDILRARGIECLCKVYTDNHSLGKVETQADSSVNTVLWILGHLRP